MPRWIVTILVLSVWCQVAAAKPKLAVLGLETGGASDAQADPKDRQIASLLTDALRDLPRTGTGKFELAPGSDRELLDEKVAGNCDTEAPACMAPIGTGLEADYLVHGKLEKASRDGQDGYAVSLKLFDVAAKPPRLVGSAATFVPLSTFAGRDDEVQARTKDWARQVHTRLTGEAPPADPTPSDAGLEPQPLAPPLTLGAGKLLLAGSTVNIDFTDIFDYDDPVLLSFAPSVWYGINDQLTIGITHDFGTTPWTPRPPFLTYFTTSEQPGEVDSVLGGGLCVSDGCPKPARSAYYNSTGADALFSLTRGRLSLAAHPGLDGTVRSPFVLDLRIGLLARLIVTDRISMVIDPRLRYGLVGRGSYHDAIDLPIWVWCDIAGPLSIHVHTGYRARLDYLKDNYSITLQYGANVKLGQRLAIGLDLGFDRVNESFAERALGLRIMYAP